MVEAINKSRSSEALLCSLLNSDFKNRIFEGKMNGKFCGFWRSKNLWRILSVIYHRWITKFLVSDNSQESSRDSVMAEPVDVAAMSEPSYLCRGPTDHCRIVGPVGPEISWIWMADSGPAAIPLPSNRVRWISRLDIPLFPMTGRDEMQGILALGQYAGPVMAGRPTYNLAKQAAKGT